MVYDDFLVAFYCLFFAIARSKETLTAWHGVGGCLLGRRGEECAAEVSCVFVLVGEHHHFFARWMSHICKELAGPRVFDATRGYPGEDISSLFH